MPKFLLAVILELACGDFEGTVYMEFYGNILKLELVSHDPIHAALMRACADNGKVLTCGGSPSPDILQVTVYDL